MAVVGSLRLLTSRTVADHPPVVVAIDATAPEEDDLAIPSDVKTVFLGGLFALAVLAGCYVAAEIALPIVLAFVLSLVLQPTMRQLERLYLPRGIAALLIIVMLFGTLAGLGTALSGPAASWAQELPPAYPNCGNA
jgi:predicted PurR-regulated permease PerM